ncbi:apolipoprotein N-acyltransferase [Aristophania vespae]|uniref:apolipoprotein N-acyltransferase n=1 Tax=Aristophania vespae TaxID=2697033 RepID=UPI0023516982|nr:apolipoprotein N-acyltransferase [Aristophania vespae]UMM64158.1 Apolipoprotein N-acyltransferase [Aristophania vespae]
MYFFIERYLPQSGWRLGVVLLFVGALTALALPPLNIFPILVLTLPCLYQAALKAPTARKAALRGFLFGMGFHSAGLYWLTNAILTRVHDYWWAVPFAAPGVAFVIAPLIAVPAVLCRYVAPGWPRIFLFAGSWTLADMSRVLIFSGFPWNPLGSALEVPSIIGDILIQPASIIGVDGLTLALVLSSLGFWEGYKGKFFVLLGSIIWVAGGGWLFTHPHYKSVENPKLVVVQGNVSEREVLGRDDAFKQFQSYLLLTRTGVEKARKDIGKSPIVVVWPESAFPGLLDEDGWARSAIAQAADGATSLIGSDRRDGKHWYNSLEAVGPDGAIKAIYDKSRLVPFGEYQPWIIPFNILPGVITPGDGLKTWDFPEVGRVGPMVCYEIIFSGSVTAPHDRPNWLLTISNDAWYGHSAGPYQHLATGRMRAVEEGLPVVFVNNRGVSAIYDSRGHEMQRTHWGAEEIIVSTLPKPKNRPLFSYLSKSIPLFIAICMAVFSFLWRKNGIFTKF